MKTLKVRNECLKSDYTKELKVEHNLVLIESSLPRVKRNSNISILLAVNMLLSVLLVREPKHGWQKFPLGV